MSSVRSVAILDFGSARTKLLLGSMQDERISFDRYKEETGLGGSLTKENMFSESSQLVLMRSTQDLLSIAISLGATHIIPIATEAFRRAANAEVVRAQLENIVGPVCILSGTTEGMILYSAMAQILRDMASPFVLIDVGGGSVQIAWGPSEREVKSIPTGTFSLERNFQTGNEPSTAQLAEMEQFIYENARRAIPDDLSCATMVLGSNSMEDFIVSSLLVIGVRGTLSSSGFLTVAREMIETLFHDISVKRYDDLASYYPQNPYFMRGADKALLNVLVISKLIRARQIIPTNESIGTALARLALSRPGTLSSLGLKVNKI